MTKRYSLIVTDTSPLFTLALAGSLDVLLRPGMPIRIPDAVYIEATRVHGAPGAEQIVEWINAHLDTAQIVPTDTGIDQQRRLEEGRNIRGLGEQAAVEALDRFLRSDPTAEALLLFEDSDIQSRRVIVDARVGVISTGDFLRELEAARLIQSTDFILDEAAAQGRNVERQRQAGADATTRERLREQLAREVGQEQSTLAERLGAPPTSKAAKKAALAQTRAEIEQSIQQGQAPHKRDRER